MAETPDNPTPTTSAERVAALEAVAEAARRNIVAAVRAQTAVGRGDADPYAEVDATSRSLIAALATLDEHA